MQTWTAKIISKSEIAENTLQVELEKPEGFSFNAGQNCNFKLPDLLYEDKRGPRRTFTLASAPQEETLIICTRKSDSGFKRTLLELDPGTIVEFNGPSGNMLYYKDLPAVFIAGGMGITPFRSMVIAHKNDFIQNVSLIYSNSHLASLAYHNDFIGLDDKTFCYTPIITGDPEWTGVKQRVDIKVIRQYGRDYKTSVFYLCGPPRMVEQLTDLLKENGTAPELIKSESFFGY